MGSGSKRFGEPLEANIHSPAPRVPGVADLPKVIRARAGVAIGLSKSKSLHGGVREDEIVNLHPLTVSKK